MRDGADAAAGAPVPRTDAEARAAGGDGDERVEHARGLAWRALNRRDRTVEEMRGVLAGKGIDPAATETVVAELIAAGYLDDARYAMRFAEDRRDLDGWGSERIGRRLTELGVAAHHVAAAVGADDGELELERARELLARRHPGQISGDRDRSRALGLLVRRGYRSEVAYEAIRRHTGSAG